MGLLDDAVVAEGGHHLGSGIVGVVDVTGGPAVAAGGIDVGHGVVEEEDAGAVEAGRFCEGVVDFDVGFDLAEDVAGVELAEALQGEVIAEAAVGDAE